MKSPCKTILLAFASTPALAIECGFDSMNSSGPSQMELQYFTAHERPIASAFATMPSVRSLLGDRGCDIGVQVANSPDPAQSPYVIDYKEPVAGPVQPTLYEDVFYIDVPRYASTALASGENPPMPPAIPAQFGQHIVLRRYEFTKLPPYPATGTVTVSLQSYYISGSTWGWVVVVASDHTQAFPGFSVSDVANASTPTRVKIQFPLNASATAPKAAQVWVGGYSSGALVNVPLAITSVAQGNLFSSIPSSTNGRIVVRNMRY